MVRRVRLYAVINVDGKYIRHPVEFVKGRPVEPRPESGHVTSYKVRIAGKFIDAGTGTDFGMAVTKLLQEQARLSVGVERSDAVVPLDVRAVQTPAPDGKIRLDDSAKDFLGEMRTLDRRKGSVAAYTNAMRGFQQSCKKEFVQDITRKDVLAYIDWMRENLPVRVKGSENRTYKNRLGYLRTFLARHGVKLIKTRGDEDGLLYRSDLPKVVKKRPKKFEQATIDLLLSKANPDERDYLELLLWSGFRDEEVQFLLYSDLNFKASTATVRAKPKYDWRPKDCEEREITLPSAVTQRLKARRERMGAGADDLIFPNEIGTPDYKLLKRLHAVAEKAGLNLQGQRAGHMFRKTAGSRVARKLGLPAAMEFLGHSNIETTALYLAADTADQTKKRKSADEMYEQAGD